MKSLDSEKINMSLITKDRSKKVNTHVHTHTHTHIYICVCVCVYVCVCVCLLNIVHSIKEKSCLKLSLVSWGRATLTHCFNIYIVTTDRLFHCITTLQCG